MSSSRISFRVHGTVQGVNYRNFAKSKAAEYGVTGWVSNAPKGEVEGEAQGSAEALEKLVKELNRGPTHARVERVEKQEVDVVEGDGEFEVRY